MTALENTLEALGATVGAMADHESAVLLAVGGVLHREIAIDDLLARMVDHIAAAMSADRGTIYLLDRSRGELVSRAAHLPELDAIRLALGQGIAGYVAERGEVVNVPRTTSEARFYGEVDRKTGYVTESILAVPMRDHAGDILGVVQLLNKRGGPFDDEDEARLSTLAQQAAFAVEATTVYRELDAPRSQTPLALSDQFNGIVGSSGQLRRACQLTSKAAATDATVLIRGESGTGKELFARAIHVNSKRAEGPFVKVDCAALPESLVENELFGHEQGAYTGADRQARGKFDVAEGGTIFLDEIGELPTHVQGKLLRVLQDREYLRVGGTHPIRVDVRVVAATNRDLEAMVSDGGFRADLYFRIKVVEIPLPPLRHRGGDDITRLAHHFAAVAAKRHGRPVPALADATLERLRQYRWPGNVRELENCIESALVVMDGATIQPYDLPLPERPLAIASLTSAAPPSSEGPLLPLEEVERRHVLRVLEHCDGNRTAAAEMLGIGRNTLTRKLKRWGE